MTIMSATRRWWAGAVLSGVGVCLVGGCASSDRPKEVPQAAIYKAGGGDRIIYVADQDGTLYVTEDQSKSVIYSGRVTRGDRVVLDPETGLNGIVLPVAAENLTGHEIVDDDGTLLCLVLATYD